METFTYRARHQKISLNIGTLSCLYKMLPVGLYIHWTLVPCHAYIKWYQWAYVFTEHWHPIMPTWNTISGLTYSLNTSTFPFPHAVCAISVAIYQTCQTQNLFWTLVPCQVYTQPMSSAGISTNHARHTEIFTEHWYSVVPTHWISYPWGYLLNMPHKHACTCAQEHAHTQTSHNC